MKKVNKLSGNETHIAISETKRIIGGLVLAAAISLQHSASAVDVDLGTANNFAVLAGSTVTSTGNTVINGGNVGVSPGTAITGFPPGTVAPPYTTYSAGAVAAQAESDLTTAYNQAAGLAPTANLTGENLGGLTLTPGVYKFDSSAFLTGTLTLNDMGNPDAVFVFQIGSTLITASGSSVVTENEGDSTTPGISTFWQVGSSATLGTSTAFEGNILAQASITANTDASDLDGRLLAMVGAVTLDDNAITAPPAETQGSGGGTGGGTGGGSAPDTGSTLLLLGFGASALFAFRQRVPNRLLFS